MTLTSQQLRQALGETAEINKKGQDALLAKIDQIEDKKDLSKQTHLNERKTSQQAILSHLKGISEAVTEKEGIEEVTIKNPGAITEDIMAGLSIVVSTLKEELSKLDTETIINNDFSRLEELLTDKSDKEEVVQALESVEDAINSIEKTEFTDYTQVLNSIKDKIQTPDNKDILKALEKIISKEFKLPDVVQVDLDPDLIEDKMVKVKLPKEQVDAMSKMMSGGGIKNIRIEDRDGNTAKVSVDGQLHTVMEGHLCPCNSTIIPLLADATFTGDAKDILFYNGISVFVTSDADSAEMGLKVQYSADGLTNWRTAEEYTILAGQEKWFTPPSFGKYFRVTYTNGIADQTTFELTTVFRKTPFKWSSHNIEVPISGGDDAELVKAVITGKRADGVYDNVSLTNGSNMKVSIEEFDPAVAITLTDFTDNLDGEEVMQVGAAMFGRVNDTIVAPVKIDASTQDMQVIEQEHAEIHGGDHYNYCDYTAAGLAAAALVEIVITTADTDKLMHLTLSGYSGTGATIELFEGSTNVVGGTSIIPRNNNRSSVNVSAATVILNPTSITAGVRASGFLAGAGRTAGFAERGKEVILARNTTYLARITSLASQNQISWCAEWYEHIDKN